MLKGKIKEVREDGTAVIVAPIDFYQYVHRNVKECYIDYIDSRPLSDKQRRMCYALMNAIAEWSGSEVEDVKEAFKMEFWAEQVETLADKIFSLSNAPMSLVASFQKFLIKFIISNDVPLKFSLLEYVDDIQDYVYQCLINKKCAVCGKRADLHHIDAIGMGNDRTQVTHLGREVMSLCRIHHTEMHGVGKKDFFDKYHFNSGVIADKTVLKIYGLKR
ncbi:MAG: hypothetical protein IJD77_00845 [Clostridia bacterium]|nr:hypothetical protein [Clostridia bacterium]